MQKIAALPALSEALEYFGPAADFKSDIPYLPDDVMASGSWEYDSSIRFRLLYRKLIPALVFFLNGKVLCIREKSRYRIWFGDPVSQEELIQYQSVSLLTARTLKKERVRQDTPYEFIGYCTDKQNQNQFAFLFVHAAQIQKKQLLKNEFLVGPQDIIRFYFKLEPLSRKLFDVFYETPALCQRYFSV